MRNVGLMVAVLIGAMSMAGCKRQVPNDIVQKSIKNAIRFNTIDSVVETARSADFAIVASGSATLVRAQVPHFFTVEPDRDGRVRVSEEDCIGIDVPSQVVR